MKTMKVKKNAKKNGKRWKKRQKDILEKKKLKRKERKIS